MMRWLAALLLVLIASPALAQEEAKPAWYGVWLGTIGRYPVMACLSDDEPYRIGAYYYLSQLKPIALRGSDRPGRWLEEPEFQKNGSSWSSVKVDGDRLNGEWRDGSRALPISLEREKWSPFEEYAGPCSSEAFLDPRTGGGRIDESEASLGGQAYRKRTYVPPAHIQDAEIVSFQLFPARAGDQAINAVLAKDLPDGTARSAMMRCMGWTLESNGTDGYYGLLSEPILIASRWLATADRYENFCGGAHPNNWSSFRLFDRETGEQVDLFDWLNDEAVNREVFGDEPESVYVTVKGTLRTQILAAWSAENGSGIVSEEDAELSSECEEVIERQESWSIGLVGEGLQFEPILPRVIMACGATVTIPWPKLEPFLSDQGKAGLAALRADEAP